MGPTAVVVDGNRIGYDRLAVLVRIGYHDIVPGAATADGDMAGGRIVGDGFDIKNREFGGDRFFAGAA